MMFYRIVKYLILVNVFKETFSATCPCQDSSSGAVWGPISEMDTCDSGCDSSNQTERRFCQIISSTNPESIECVIVRPCPQVPCQGQWSAWGNVEVCSNICGNGKRKQTRSCYKVGTYNLLNSFCLGGYGSSTQERVVACRSISGCNGPRSIPPATLSQETRSIKTTQPFTEETTNVKNSLPNQVSKAFDVVTLGAVLGAVGLVCLSVTIVVIIIIIKRKRPRQQNIEPSVSRHIQKQQQIERGDHNYEEVGPPLPPVRQGASSSTTNKFETSPQIPTAIYIQANDNGGHHLSEDAYMEPIPSPNRPEFHNFGKEIEISEYVQVDQFKN